MDDRDVTVPGVSNTAKIMDDILQDGDWKAFIDWTITNPIGATGLKARPPGPALAHIGQIRAPAAGGFFSK